MLALTSVLGSLDALSLLLRPFVAINSLAQYQCVPGPTVILGVNLEWADGSVIDGAVLEGSAICLAADGGANATCTPLAANMDIPPLVSLRPGCHTALAWWLAADGAETGIPYAVLFQVAGTDGRCTATCSSPAHQPLDVLTGGCTSDGGGGNSSGGGGGGDGMCCPAGCCEFASGSCAPQGLPPCGSCLAGARPPRVTALTDALPQAAARATAAALLGVVKRAVLGTLYAAAPPHIVDGSQWPGPEALSMVGVRRLDHFHALVDDVVLRGVPGDGTNTSWGRAPGEGAGRKREPPVAAPAHPTRRGRGWWWW